VYEGRCTIKGLRCEGGRVNAGKGTRIPVCVYGHCGEGSRECVSIGGEG